LVGDHIGHRNPIKSTRRIEERNKGEKYDFRILRESDRKSGI
jgi:hypothetical protein